MCDAIVFAYKTTTNPYVIIVHDILNFYPSDSFMIQDLVLQHVPSCGQYGTVSYGLCVVIFAKITLKSFTSQDTVQCALMVVVTREESCEAMAEWVMFDAPFSDVSGIPSANFFPFQHLM